MSNDVTEDGTVLVSGRLLAEIASRLPNAPVEFSTAEGKIAVRCGSTRFTLSSMPVEEYPSLPVVDGASGVLPGEAFSDAVGQVSVAASRDDVTPVITGVQLEITDNRLSLVATDRYRVAVREIDWQSSAVADGVTALVPSRTLSEIGKIFAHAATVTVTIVSGGDRELI
ncbi:MAG: DNA polymerase III subunit beta, partial [Microcella sp.]|nr:DNA polymerase III subunit beta [Microcella sp.]